MKLINYLEAAAKALRSFELVPADIKHKALLLLFVTLVFYISTEYLLSKN